MVARGITSLVAFGVVTALLYFVMIEPELNHLRPLAVNSRQTAGSFVNVDWNNHTLRTYAYVVGGRTYTGETLEGPTSQGSPVTVYYLPDRPERSVVGVPPRTRRDRVVREGWLVCPAFGAVVAILAWWRFPEAQEYLARVYEPPGRPGRA